MSSRITFLDLHYQSVGSMLAWLELTQVNLKLTSQRYFSKSRSRRGEIIAGSTCSDHSHEKLSWDKMIGTRFEKNKVRYSVTVTWLQSNVSKSWNWTDAPRSEILPSLGVRETKLLLVRPVMITLVKNGENPNDWDMIWVEQCSIFGRLIYSGFRTFARFDLFDKDAGAPPTSPLWKKIHLKM